MLHVGILIFPEELCVLVVQDFPNRKHQIFANCPGRSFVCMFFGVSREASPSIRPPSGQKSETTDSIAVPGCDQFFERWQRRDPFYAQRHWAGGCVYHGREFDRSRVHHEPNVEVRADGEGLYLTEGNNEDARQSIARVSLTKWSLMSSKRSSSSTTCTAAVLVLVCSLLNATTSAPCMRGMEDTQNNTTDENIAHPDNEIDRADLERLEGMEIGVIPVRPDAIVSNSEHISDRHFFFESLNVRFSYCSSFSMEEEEKRKWQTQRKPKRRKREPKRKLVSPTAMSCRITSSRTLLQIITRSPTKVRTRWTRSSLTWPCTWERSAERQSASSVTGDEALPESRTKLREEQRSRKPFSTSWIEGKLWIERKTIEDSNIKNETTLEMTWRVQCGMKEDEMMTSARTAEDRNLWRKHSEIGDIQLSDDREP